MRYNANMASIASAEEVNLFHLNSDKDSSVFALHHTIGLGPNQAAAGNHTHNGKDSPRLDFNDLLNGWINMDCGKPDTVFGGMDAIDCGGI
jgi:hypothetical protein